MPKSPTIISANYYTSNRTTISGHRQAIGIAAVCCILVYVKGKFSSVVQAKVPHLIHQKIIMTSRKDTIKFM